MLVFLGLQEEQDRTALTPHTPTIGGKQRCREPRNHFLFHQSPLCNVSSWPSASAFIAIRTGWVGAPSKDTIISHKTFASHYVAARFMAGNLSGCPLGTLLTPLWRARRATVHSNHFYLPKCHNLGFDSQGRYKKKSCVGSEEGSCLVNRHIFTVVQQAETPMVTSRLHSCPIVFQIRTLSPLVIISQGCLTKYDTISSP